MSTYPNLENDRESLKIETREDGIEGLRYKSEKYDYGKNLKSPKIRNESYEKKYKSLNKKKVLLIIIEILLLKPLQRCR